jgi:hypothetical protein
MTGNGNGGEEANNSGEEFIATIECDFKRQNQPSKDQFKKLFEVACPHHLLMRACLSWIQAYPHAAILRHLLNTVNSFFCSFTNYFKNRLLPNFLFIGRNHGDDKEDK